MLNRQMNEERSFVTHGHHAMRWKSIADSMLKQLTLLIFKTCNLPGDEFLLSEFSNNCIKKCATKTSNYSNVMKIELFKTLILHKIGAKKIQRTNHSEILKTTNLNCKLF